MSRRTVRAAIQAYLTAGLPGIPGLQKVYRAAPWFVDGATAFNLGAGLGNGAFAYLHLSRSRNNRLSVPAVLGVSSVHYDVAVIICYQFEIPSTTTDPALITEDMWVDACDDIIQGVKNHIQADPELGAPGVILLAAQTQDTLDVDSDEPRLEGGKVYSWHAITFQITEIITA